MKKFLVKLPPKKKASLTVLSPSGKVPSEDWMRYATREQLKELCEQLGVKHFAMKMGNLKLLLRYAWFKRGWIQLTKDEQKKMNEGLSKIRGWKA